MGYIWDSRDERCPLREVRLYLTFLYYSYTLVVMVLMELAVTVVAVLTIKALLEFIREQIEILEMLVAAPVQETDQQEAVYRPMIPGK